MGDYNDDNGVKYVSNRVLYVEPNYNESVPMQGPRGLHSYEFENPLEDYCIYVSLSVEVRGRVIRTDYVSNKKEMGLTYVSQQGKERVSFFQGSKYPDAAHNVYKKDVYSLTTDYDRHIYLEDLVKKDVNDKVSGTNATTELFGINSIDIQYNNWMVPQVTIKFTDIRGASLFAVEEARHHMTDSAAQVDSSVDTSVEGSFFKCFFTFPYPKFTLTVKGFYGQPVAYELTVSDFRASFNSNTGNFEATATFVGYAYSFLGDVMMNALTAAPFSDYLGRKYWDEQVSNGRFTVKGENGQQVAMKRIGEIVANIDAAMKKAEGMAANSTAGQEQQKLDQQNNSLTAIIKAYNEYVRAITDIVGKEFNEKSVGNFRKVITDSGDMLVFIPDADEGDTFEGTTSHFFQIGEHDAIEKAYDALLAAAQQANNDTVATGGATGNSSAKDNGGSSASNSSTPKVINDYVSKVKALDWRKVKAVRVYDKTGNGYSARSTFARYANLQNGVKSNLQVSNADVVDKETLIEREELENVFPFLGKSLYEALMSEKQQNDADVEKNQQEVSKATQEALKDCLGFNPTIESVTRIIMAHFETLTYMVTKCARDITAQTRTLESLGIQGLNVKDIQTDDNKISGGDKIIPPFPKVTSRVTENDVEKDEESWVGDFDGDWLEEDLVNGILNGINEMTETIKAGEAGIAPEDSSRMSAVMKIPLSPLDLILDKNPYGGINFTDKSSFAGHVALRMFAVLGLTDKFKSDGAKKLGEAEAINFANFFSSPNSEFKSWLGSKTVVNDIINITQAGSSTPVSKYGKEGKYAWESRNAKSNVSKALMRNWTLREFRGKGRTFLPVQDASFDNILRDLGTPDGNGKYKYPLNSENYIVSSPPDELLTGGKRTKPKANKIICIETNVDRFSTIIENQCKATGVEGELGGVYAMKTEAQYSKSKYNTLFNNDNIATYTVTNGASSSSDSKDRKEAESVTLSTPTNVKDWAKNLGDGASVFFNDDTHKTDSVSVVYVPALDYAADPTHLGTLFAQKFYYALTMEEKAFSFLRALSYYVNYDMCIGSMASGSDTFSNVPYCAVLYLCALCYFSETVNRRKAKNNTVLDSLNKLASRNKDLKAIRSDVRNDLSNYFKSWVSSEYRSIDGYLSLKVSVNTFFKECSDICGVFVTSDSAIKNLVETYMQESKSVYSAIDSEFHKINSVGVSFRLGINQKTNVASSLTKIVLNPTTFLKTCKFFSEKNETISVGSGGKAFIQGFVDKLKTLYDTSSDGSTDSSDVQRSEDCETDKDIKIGVYRYLKLLYDKWIAGSVFETDFTMEKFFGENPDLTESDDGRYFYFIDSYYNRIGNNLLVNIGKFKDDVLNCELQDGYTLLSFMGQLCAENKCNFLCIQNFFDLSKEEKLKSVFKPVPLVDMDQPNVTPNFIIQYAYETSSHLDLGSSGDYTYPDDSFSIKNKESDVNKWPAPLNSPNTSGYRLPAFGVSYGKMYQSYFQNISISMDNPMVTEQSIKAQFQIAAMNHPASKDNANEGGATRGMITMGQDLFTVYSNNSYTCEIDMMGDAWIQPLMYFELLNVPMFRGTYLVEKVSHHIEAGNMTTHVTGVRMANTCTKLKKGWYWLADPSQTGANSETTQESLASVFNDCEYVEYPLGGTQSINGLLLTANGLSVINFFEAGNKEWYINGDTVKSYGYGCYGAGPGMTIGGGYFKNSDIGKHQSAEKLKRMFVNDCLKRYDVKIRKWIKGKSFSKGAIDSMYYMMHWKPSAAAARIPKYNTNEDVAKFWDQVESNEPGGWRANIAFWKWITTDKKPSSYESLSSAYKQKADHAMNIYRTGNAKLIRALNMSAPSVNESKRKGGSIWNDFIAAVSQTCMDTPSCGVNIGSKEVSTNKGYITANSADKLADVFDILLYTYSKYIKELWWVARNNKDVNGPLRIELVIAKKINSLKDIKVGMKIDGGRPFAQTEAFQGINKNSNEKYRRSIVKFYSKNGRHVNGNENKGTYGTVVKSKIPVSDWSSLRPTACSDVMGGGNSGVKGKGNAAVAAQLGFSSAHPSKSEASAAQVWVTLANGKRVQIHKKLAGEIQAIFKEIKDTTNFNAYSVGGFCYRNVAGTGRLSAHAFGMAVDVNARDNPYHYDASHSDDNIHMRTNAHPVVKIFKKYGWYWGGNFKNRKDYMHFSKSGH